MGTGAGKGTARPGAVQRTCQLAHGRAESLPDQAEQGVQIEGLGEYLAALSLQVLSPLPQGKHIRRADDDGYLGHGRVPPDEVNQFPACLGRPQAQVQDEEVGGQVLQRHVVVQALAEGVRLVALRALPDGRRGWV
jgi:hypothetical protein